MNTDEHGLRAWVIGAALMAAAAIVPAVAATPVPSGKWSFVFTDRRGQADRPLRVYTYRPRQCDSKCPIVFAMHGKSRKASAMRDHWELPADRYGFMVIAPEFSDKHWPDAADYNLGGVGDDKNREKWAYSMVEHLFDEMRDGQKDYAIFGHSAGAQFAHRLLVLLPENRVSVAIAANAGWYLMPEWRKEKASHKYPHSLVDSPAGEAELRRALQKRMVVLLGEKDVNAQDADLDQSDGSKKQGENRLERGESFFGAATTAARDLGVKLAWELSYVPGAGHDSAAMSKAAADFVWGGKK
jgi:pimeloyl-ACP methyl ester carboxylesterase